MIAALNAGRAKFQRHKDWGDLAGDWGRLGEILKMQRKQKRNIQIATFLVLCSVFHGVLVIKIGAPSPGTPGEEGTPGKEGRGDTRGRAILVALSDHGSMALRMDTQLRG